MCGAVGFDSLADDLASVLKQAKKREALRRAITDWRGRQRGSYKGAGDGGATAPTAAAVVALDWSCGACTFENPGGEIKCGMCGTEAGAAGRANLKKQVGSVVRSLR